MNVQEALSRGQLKICLEFRREVGIEDKMAGDITSTQLSKLTMREILRYFLTFTFCIQLPTPVAPYSSTLAWKIPCTEGPGRLQSMGSLESDTTEQLHFHFSLSCSGEGNGNPLQCSCLENPRDGGAWWAAIYGVTQSWT